MSARALLAALVLATASTLAAAAAPAGVHVEGAWIRWLPAQLPAAGYATVVNDGEGSVRLVGASSPDYGMVMLHRSRLDHGDSTMEHVDGVDIPAHGRLVLAPGGYHLMLTHPAHPLKPGDAVTLVLEFAGGETLGAKFPVRPANSTGPAD